MPEIRPGLHGIDVKACELMLLDTKRILDSNKVEFWLYAGTFLGIYREGRLLPYDQDMDLMIRYEDGSRLIRCGQQFRQKDFRFTEQDKQITPGSRLYRDEDHIDIFLFKPEGSKRVWRAMKLDKVDFEIRRRIKFLGKRWRILNNPEKWLSYMYGDNWRTPIPGKSIKDKGEPYGG